MSGFQNYGQYISMLFSGDSVWDIIYNFVIVYSMVTGEFIFWSFIILMSLVPGYITTGTVLVPCTTYLFIGGFLVAVAPPELSMPMYIILVVGISGILYHFFTKR